VPQDSVGIGVQATRTTMPKRKILVVGGGIGGLAMAIGLGRAGTPCDMVEIKQDWAVYGVGLIQPGNALRAYRALGLLDACLERGFLYSKQRHYAADGTLMSEQDMPQIEGLDIVGTCGIARPVLHDILTSEALALGTNVRLGTTVDTLHDDGDGVDVGFSDGTSGRYDLVVGADGIYSKLREMVFGSETNLHYTGQGCWRFTTERPPEMTWTSAHYGPNKTGLIPLSERSMYIYMLSAEPEPRMPQDRLHDLMRERLHGYQGLIADIAVSIRRPEDVVYRPLEVMLLPKPWHRGRVVLIGDAVHATTPHNAQGAAMAIEDVVVLLEILGSVDDIETALTAFSARRFDRCKLVVEASEQIGIWQLRPTPTSQNEAIALHTSVRHVLAAPV
jgi:2-polyprenyl-6-methoxyphenol hydroxylase-like FAD-dependent oxidoreductase